MGVDVDEMKLSILDLAGKTCSGEYIVTKKMSNVRNRRKIKRLIKEGREGCDFGSVEDGYMNSKLLGEVIDSRELLLPESSIMNTIE